MSNGTEKFIELLTALSDYCMTQFNFSKTTADSEAKKNAIGYITRVGKTISALTDSLLEGERIFPFSYTVELEIDPIKAKDAVHDKLDVLSQEATKIADASTDPVFKELYTSISKLMTQFKSDPQVRIILPQIYWLRCSICGGIFGLRTPLYPPPYSCKFCGAPYWHFIPV